MPKGRTAWEILTGQNKTAAEDSKVSKLRSKIYNPLGAKIKSLISIDCLLSDIELTNNELWTVRGIFIHERKIGKAECTMTDYLIESDGATLIVRTLPKNSDPFYHILLLKQYYPDYAGGMPWGDESPYVIAAANDPTGEFYRNRGQEDEEKYVRIGGNIPILCNVYKYYDDNNDGNVTDDEVKADVATIWDFHREISIADKPTMQYLYIELGGHFKGCDYDNEVPKVYIDGGDKLLTIFRGEELLPSQVTIF